MLMGRLYIMVYLIGVLMLHSCVVSVWPFLPQTSLIFLLCLPSSLRLSLTQTTFWGATELKLGNSATGLGSLVAITDIEKQL